MVVWIIPRCMCWSAYPSVRFSVAISSCLRRVPYIRTAGSSALLSGGNMLPTWGSSTSSGPRAFPRRQAWTCISQRAAHRIRNSWLILEASRIRNALMPQIPQTRIPSSSALSRPFPSESETLGLVSSRVKVGWLGPSFPQDTWASLEWTPHDRSLSPYFNAA